MHSTDIYICNKLIIFDVEKRVTFDKLPDINSI